MPFKSVHPYEETEAGDEQLLKKPLSPTAPILY